jgi:tRNA(Arg) A34 adenosine deaminase TadA
LYILLGPEEKGHSYFLAGALDHAVFSVPIRPPHTREHFEAGRNVWPMVFHEYRKENVRSEFDEFVSKLVNSSLEESLQNQDVCIMDDKGKQISCAQRDAHHPVGHPVMLAINNAAKIIQPPAYLCTDCIVFCRREPCLMCAMALLHSRIAAIVFVEEIESDSPFSAQIYLQGTPGLNHYYKVYKAGRWNSINKGSSSNI